MGALVAFGDDVTHCDSLVGGRLVVVCILGISEVKGNRRVEFGGSASSYLEHYLELFILPEHTSCLE